jgi:hypothetical protein
MVTASTANAGQQEWWWWWCDGMEVERCGAATEHRTEDEVADRQSRPAASDVCARARARGCVVRAPEKVSGVQVVAHANWQQWMEREWRARWRADGEVGRENRHAESASALAKVLVHVHRTQTQGKE